MWPKTSRLQVDWVYEDLGKTFIEYTIKACLNPSWYFMRMIIGLLILAVISLQYKLWLGDGSVLQLKRVQKQLTSQEEENKRLLARNHAMEADILELKSGEQSLEEQARYELGMIKDGEVYYYFLDEAG